MEVKDVILIIDDNEDDYLIIKRHVKDRYRTEYNDGKENIFELINNYKPDCILLDYHLNQKKGIELLKEIKSSKNENISSKPVVILTGETNPEIIVECMKNNATDYIIKSDYRKSDIKKTIFQSIEKEKLKKIIKENEIEKKRLEKLLNHNRRINSIGQLAGGIAHDFNNILAGILGASELLKAPERKLDKTSFEYVDMIIKASNRASSLVSKLLSYGRKGSVVFSVWAINDIMSDIISILNTTIIDKRISIILRCEVKDNKIIGDAVQLQNAFMNIIINASQAMPLGGEVRIRTSNIYLDKKYCEKSSFDIKEGNYIKIEIEDTGIGIPQENIPLIFEPFFTTKKINKGTGLGLSAVYGIIQEHHGEITVTSELEVGTIFSILIPCAQTNIDVKKIIKSNNKKELNNINKATILLVDDEDLIRITGSKILKSMGYRVFTAVDGIDAVDIFKEKHHEIDIVIMDMLMPKLNGREAFSEMIKINKDCKVIISSGYLKDNDIDSLKKEGLSGFIKKPYKSSDLNEIIQKILKENKISFI